MIRKMSLIAAAALVVSALGMTPAGAAGPPATGTLSCGTTGSAILKPGIPGSGQPDSVKAIKLKAKNSTIDACNNAGVVGGKEPITGGLASLSGSIAPGANCSKLLTTPPVLDKPKLTLKFTGADGKTVAKATIKALTLTQVGTGFALDATIPQNAKGNAAFGGEHLTVQINVDNLADAVACINPGSMIPLTHIDFSTTGGSSLSIS